jgi:peptidyl-prolyl cis-trans isomerase C
MTSMKLPGAVLVLGMAASLSACGEKKAEGQVLAVVNGTEVTQRDVAAEPAVQNLPAGQDADAMIKNVLGGVVDRQLAVEAAKELDLDETPEYIAEKQRADAVLLSQKLFERWTAGMSAPTDAEIADFKKKNPQIFGDRKILLLERMVAPIQGYDPKDLGPLNTMDEIAAYFQGKNIKFERGRTQVDSAKLDPKIYGQLNKLDRGYPMAMVGEQGIQIIAVVDSKSAPITPEEAKQVATAGIRQELIQQKINQLRNKAKITYQKGYEPNKDKPVGSGNGAAAPGAPAANPALSTPAAKNAPAI